MLTKALDQVKREIAPEHGENTHFAPAVFLDE